MTRPVVPHSFRIPSLSPQCALADLVESAEKLVPSYEGSSFIEVFLASQVAYGVPESASREPSSMNLMYRYSIVHWV